MFFFSFCSAGLFVCHLVFPLVYVSETICSEHRFSAVRNIGIVILSMPVDSALIKKANVGTVGVSEHALRSTGEACAQKA